MVRFGRGYPIKRVTTGIAKTPVLFDAVGSGAASNSNSTTMSITHTAAAGARVLVDILINNPATAVSGVTYGGSNMTQLTSLTLPNGSFGDAIQYRYSFTDVTGGTRTVSVTFGGAGNAVVFNSSSYKNVSTVSAAQTATGSTASMSQSVTCSANQMIVQAFGAYDNNNGTWSSLSGGTNRYNNFSSQQAGLTISTAAASATFNATNGDAGIINPAWGAMAHVLS